MEKRPALPRTQNSLNVEAPFMTPGTEAERQTPTRHDGAHAAQRRTHAGDMNVAPTLTAVPTCTDEKTAEHHDRTATYPAVPTCTDEKNNGSSRPHGGIPRRGAIYDARNRSGKTNTDETRRRTRSATTHARGRHECRPYAARRFPHIRMKKRRDAMAHARGRHECRPYAAGGSHTHG